MEPRGHLVLLPPNRVWRSYPGGQTLDRLAGIAAPRDSSLAEDWIGSVTESRFAGREQFHEGIAQVQIGAWSGSWRQALSADPEYFFGAAHARRYGAEPMLLVKFLDSAIRLCFQAHPTADFARKFLSAESGKTEAYHILAVRPEMAPGYIYLGFQRPPSPAEMKRMVEAQDIAAMERCFDKISVQPGDTFVIPAGCPHALGEGLFLVEIQEPTDFVARYEFERAGYVLPEAARFMGRDVDFGLSLLDFTARPLAAIDRDFRCQPRRLRDFGPGSWQEELIGPKQTPCFRVNRTHLGGPVARTDGEFYIGIVTAGTLTAEAGGTSHRLNRYDRFAVPAGLGELRLIPEGEADILECCPPAVSPP